MGVRLPWIPAFVATALTLTLVGGANAALSPVSASPSVDPEEPKLPNVLLILTDDQRAGTELAMPTVMNDIAAQGTTFTQAFVPTPLCCPSRASLLTGKFAHNTGVWLNSVGSAWGAWTAFARGGEETDTLATRLQSAGYRTGLFGKYINRAHRAGSGYVPPGWDEWVAYFGGGYTRYRLSTDNQRVLKDRPYLTDALAESTVSFIESAPADQPVFTYFAPYAPHYPFDPGPYAGRTRALGLLNSVKAAARYPSPATNRADMSGYPRWMSRLTPSEYWNVDGRAVQQALTLDQVVERQSDMLYGVDVAVDRILEALRDAGRLDNTLIIFTSDNGFAWGDHRLQGKSTPHDVSIRVPLMMRYDGHIQSGAIDSRIVGANIDVHATILDFAGLSSSAIDGRSVRAPAVRDGLLVEEAPYKGRPAYCGYRTREHLYVRYSTGEEELYDYRVDPFELRNLSGDANYAEVKGALETKTREACSPRPPGFTWDGTRKRLDAPTRVAAHAIAPPHVMVTWRAPDGVGPTLPRYHVYVGKVSGRPACNVGSSGLKKGLQCRIVMPRGRDSVDVTVMSIRGNEVAQATPITVRSGP